jgi:GNAT superfamily N-acetyltransferase
LFLHPQYEGKRIGKRLHDIMLAWYFRQTKETVWLTTAFHTRAETFYRMQGWREAGMHSTKEIKFEMSVGDWNKNRFKK